MSRRIQVQPVTLPVVPFDKFLSSASATRAGGGAHVAAFDVGTDRVFDWYASRNNLGEERVLDRLLSQPMIRESVPPLAIPSRPEHECNFERSDNFSFDGELAAALYNSGRGNGRTEKGLAMEVCHAMFELRFAEISCYRSREAWTAWFKGASRDLTTVVFDQRLRRLWLFAFTGPA